MFSFRKKKEPSFYTKEQIERRNECIPSFQGLPCFEKNRKNAAFKFFDDSLLFKSEKASRYAFPPSIEYIFFKNSREHLEKLVEGEVICEEFLEKGTKLTKAIKKTFAKELIDESDAPDFVAEEHGHKLQTLTNQPEISPEEFGDIDLASEEQIHELGKLQMDFYSVLAQLQDSNISSDFRAAYDIQDKVSYILDNRNLCFSSLVNSLIFYMKKMISELEGRVEEIHRKQKIFAEFNSKVSKLKEYKYKTDESFKLLSNNQKFAESEIAKNLEILNSSTD